MSRAKYTHDVIVGQERFVHASDDAIHTRSVESLWMRVKRELRRQFGFCEALFTSHVREFACRERRKNSRAFSAFICCLIRQFTV